MPRLFDKDTGKTIGEIAQAQIDFLADKLEEEHSGDQDYYLNRDTLDMLEEQGADEELLELLKKAMGESDEVEIAWE